MAGDVATLGVKIDTSTVKNANADLDSFSKKSAQAGGAASGFKSATDRTIPKVDALGQSARKTADSTDSLSGAIKRAAVAMAAYVSVREIAQAAEQWTVINNRLKLVTESSAALATAQDAIFAIAQNSRQPLGETAELYQRIATNQKALGISSAAVAGVVDTINKSMAISGTSGASAAAALTQLGQAFASGTLRGEELNSVMEQAPALAKTIADGIGVTTGELRKMGQDGELTAQTVIQALQRQANATDEAFAKISATPTQALTSLENSFTRVIGKLDEGTGASAAFSDGIIAMSKWLDSDVLLNGVVESLGIWAATFETLSKDTSEYSNELELLSDTGVGAVNLISGAFKEMPVNIKTMIQVMTVELVSGFDKVAAYTEAFSDSIKAAFTDDTLENVGNRLDSAIAGIDDARESTLQDIFNEREAIISAAKAETERREAESIARKQALQEQQDEIDKLNEKAKAEATVKAQAKASADEESKERETQQNTLQKAFESQAQSYQRIIALSGELTEVDKIRYEMAAGKLNGLSAEQQLRLEMLAQEIDKTNALADAEQRRDALKSGLSSVQQSLATPEERESEDYKSKLGKINAAEAAGIESIKPYAQLREQLEQQHQDRLSQINNDGAAKRAAFERMTAKQKTAYVANQLQEMTASVATSNQTMFEINKAASIATAVINTYQGVTKAIAEYPPPLSYAMAAVQLASGMAQVNAIRSQTFGSASVSPSIAATGASSVTAVTASSATAVQNQEAQKQQAAPQVMVTFNGPVTGLTEEILAEKINELIERDYITMTGT